MSLSLYPIIKKLGEGGFSTTYLATNTLMPSQPYCVVKQLTPTSTDPKVQQLIKDRFKQEAITLENLGKDSNGKIPSLYAYFVERGEFYLIQEYIDGQTLNERVQTQGIFTELQVRQLLADILPTLVYVHQRGIVHRDIKPENIMLRHRDNKPILIDFGAVKETMSTTMTASGNAAQSILIGTPGFMPLEQMSGRPMFASDIYALGLTAIYLLTGKMPTEIETDSDRGNVDWQSLAPNISPQLAQVINKSIQPLVRDRYQNAQQMLQDLNISSPPFTPSPTIGSPLPISNDYEKTVYVPTPTTTSNSSSSKAKPLIAALILAIVGGGLIGGFLVLGHNYSRKESSPNQNNSQQTATSNNNPVTNSNSKITSSSSSTNERSNAPTSKNSTDNTDRNNVAIKENTTVNTARNNVASKESPTNNIDRSNAVSKENTTNNIDRSNVASKESPTNNIDRSNVASKENPTDNTDRNNAASKENPTDNTDRSNVASKENPTDNTARSNVASKENTTNNTARNNVASKENPTDNTDRDPRETVRDYYSKINNRNYSGAWDSLPIALQNNKSVHPNGYNSFLDWWAKQVADVEIQQTNLVSQTDRDAVVDVDIKYLMKKGGASPHKIRYSLVKNDRNDEWLIQKIGFR